MTPFLNLALLTLRSPAKAAEIVLAQQWRGEAVWTGLLLVAVLNALTHALMLWLFPVAQELAFLNMSPTALVGLSAGLLVVFSVAVTFCGRLIGGQGGFAQVLPGDDLAATGPCWHSGRGDRGDAALRRYRRVAEPAG